MENKVTILFNGHYKNFVIVIQSIGNMFQYFMSDGKEMYQAFAIITDIKTEEDVKNAVAFMVNTACTTVDYLAIKDDPEAVEALIKDKEIEIEALNELAKVDMSKQITSKQAD